MCSKKKVHSDQVNENVSIVFGVSGMTRLWRKTVWEIYIVFIAPEPLKYVWGDLV